MIDVSLKGFRCCGASEIIDIKGTIGAATQDTIVYELEGEGGQLVNVCWDDGSRSLVSSEEIVITGVVPGIDAFSESISAPRPTAAYIKTVKLGRQSLCANAVKL